MDIVDPIGEMNERLAALIMKELERQSQEDRWGTPYLYSTDYNPTEGATEIGVDGRLNLTDIAKAILAGGFHD